MIIYFLQRHVRIVPFSEGYAHREGMVSGVIIMNSLHQLSYLFSRYQLTPILRRRRGHWRTIAHAAGFYWCETQWRLPTAYHSSLPPAILFCSQAASCHTTYLSVKGILNTICTCGL